MTPDALPAVGGRLTDTKVIGRLIRARANELEGITISGGEPFQQPAALAEILRHAREHNLGRIVFSGYRLEELEKHATKNVAVAVALSCIDTLIDGRYDHSLNDDKGMRGSSNQRVHILSPRYTAYKGEFENGMRRQVHISKQDAVLSVGVARLDAWRRVTADAAGLTGYDQISSLECTRNE